MVVFPSENTGNAAGEETISRKINIMGDKSPKSTNKQASQKRFFWNYPVSFHWLV